MINRELLRFWSVALSYAALVVLLISGCASQEGFDNGFNDVDPYDGLKLSMKLPPPGGVSLTGGGLRRIEIKWPAPAEDIYRYRIERAGQMEGPFVFIANVDPQLRGYIDGEHEGYRLKDATTYFYRLVTIRSDDGPRSLPCAVMCATTGPPPGPVKDLRVDATGSRANTLRWAAAEGAGTLTYRVERTAADKPESFAPLGTTRELMFVDGGTKTSTLNDSTKYVYRVVTLNEVGSESESSVKVEVVTLPPPVAVTGLTGRSGEVRCVPLKWNASPESDIIEYHIFCSRNESEPFEKIAVIEGRTVTEFLHGGNNPGDLEDEATYLYQVRAVNFVGSVSDAGGVVKVVTRGVPPEGQGVEVKSGMPREVLITWNLSEDKCVKGYEIWRCLEGSDDWQQIKILENDKISRYLDRGDEDDPEELGALIDGTNYSYRVIAYNIGNVRSSASPPVSAKTKLIPVTPSGLTASSGLAGVIKLQWNSNPESDIKEYQVQSSSKENRGFRDLCSVGTSGQPVVKVEDSDLKVSVARYYRVKAIAVDRLESEWSPAVSGVTKALPEPPASLTLAGEGELSAHLTWSAPPQKDIDKYIIWQKRLIGWKQLAESKICEYKFDKSELQDVSVIAVSAVDVDGLESEKSIPVKQEVFAE